MNFNDVLMRAELRRLASELRVLISQCGPERAAIAEPLRRASVDLSAAQTAAGELPEPALVTLHKIPLGVGKELCAR